MEGAATGSSRSTGGAVAALAPAGQWNSCSTGSNGTSCRNPNFLPQFADGPPPNFPSQASFGALKLFADAAFELQSRKGGACPLAHEMLRLLDPPEPCLICLTALHAKNKTIITVSDGLCWCRVASTQLPPVPSAPDCHSGCPPDDEQLNIAAAELAGCLLRLSQLSITRTPRGKHIILCRAFYILSRDCKAIARALQAQQRPEVIFPMWVEGAATSAVQQPQQPLRQQHRAAQQQQSLVHEASQQRQQATCPPEERRTNPAYHQQDKHAFHAHQPHTEAASHPPQRVSALQRSSATVYQQHTHGSHLPAGQQRQGHCLDQEESPEHQLPTHRAQLQRRPSQQQPEQQRLPQQQLQDQPQLLRGEQSDPATALSPQRHRDWQGSGQRHRGVRDDRSQHEQEKPQVCGITVDQLAAPCKQQEQQQFHEHQAREGASNAPVDSLEENSVAGSGPQRQPGVLPTYRSAPYPPSRSHSVQQQRAQHVVRAPLGGESFIPIEDLTAYVAKWTIRARVDVKGDIRKYSNARGPGQLFNVELKDKSGEIRATFFNAAVDRWFNVLQEGKVYYFRGGAVKAKNPRFNTTRHNYEITFDEKSSILETQDEGDIPSFSSGTVDIRKIDAMQEMNATISVTAVVHDYRPMQSITIKATGQLKPKRDVYLVDESGLSICLTLWGDKAKEILEDQLARRPIVFFKNIKVGDWNGKKLDSQASTRIELYPSSDRATALQEWWNREGCTQLAFQMVSSGSGAAVGRKEVLKTLEQIGREAVQMDPSVIADKGVYFSCAALLERVSDERFSWPACPECRKKMVETVAHTWSCANCGRQFDQPNHTYMLNIMLMDTTGSLRCTCMGEKAEEVMGFVKAETLLLLQDHQSLDEQGRSFNDIFADVNLEEWIFRVCSKNDTYMDEMRLKHRVVSVTPLFRRVGDQTRHRLNFIRNTFAHFRVPCP